MSKENHPSFYGKDASNLPPDRRNRIQHMIKELHKDINQLEYDFKFAQIVARFDND
jgi:hypothetical protein